MKGEIERVPSWRPGLAPPVDRVAFRWIHLEKVGTRQLRIEEREHEGSVIGWPREGFYLVRSDLDGRTYSVLVSKAEERRRRAVDRLLASTPREVVDAILARYLLDDLEEP